MPHIREVARKFQDHSLVVLSVSLDSDEQKWKAFLAKNQMTYGDHIWGERDSSQLYH